jgi:excisionase family DNA binding protein
MTTSQPAFTYKTAAEWLNIKPSKLRRLVELRKIPCVKIERAVRFRIEDLEQYIAGCIRPAAPEGGLRLPPRIGTS